MKTAEESIILKPRHKGIIALYMLLPWLVAAVLFGFGFLSPAEQIAEGREWSLLADLVFAPIADGVIWLTCFGRTITLLPGGKIRYHHFGLKFENANKDADNPLYQRQNAGFGSMGFRFGTVKGLGGKKYPRLINHKEEFNARDVERLGYTQKMFTRSSYTWWQKLTYKKYIAVVLKNEKRMKWKLTGFRAVEIELLKEYIKKYNPQAKEYWQ